MSDDKFKKTMGSIFSGILNQSQKEIMEKYPELAKSLVNVIDQDMDTFNYEVFHAIDGVMREDIATKIGRDAWDDDVSSLVFLYSNKDYVENCLEYFITRREGTACSADKSGWLMRAFKKHFIDGEDLDMTIGEKCYWKPHFWTGEEWLQLFKAVHSMKFGNPELYFKFLKENYLPPQLTGEQ